MATNWKGIVLAGGSGTRLYPLTNGVSKQLLPIYDKPMVYYPISTLMLAQIREILVITTARDLPSYENLLGNGSDFGVEIQYAVQPSPDGLPQAFLLGSSFIGESNVSLVLGDNVFYGDGFINKLIGAKSNTEGATIFAYQVKAPQRFGVVEFDNNAKVLSIEEKPTAPKSNFAVTGLYFYDNDVIEIARSLTPSARGELEISDVNRAYLEQGTLRATLLGRGFAWLDTGTHESLMEAGHYIQAIENRQGMKVACLEEIAFRNGWLTETDIENRANKLLNTGYGEYLQNLLRSNF